MFDIAKKLFGILSAMCFFIAVCTGLIYLQGHEYVNMVWGEVLESNPQESTSDRRTTVIFSVDDGEYTGTYQTSFNSKLYFEVGDTILLKATKDYKWLLPNDVPTLGEKDWARIQIVLNVSSCIGVVNFLLMVISSLLDTYDFSWPFSNDSHDSHHSENSELDAIIRDIKRIARKCKDDSYKKVIYGVVSSMEKQAKSLADEKQLETPGTVNIVKEHHSKLKETFEQIRTMVSTTAIQLARSGYNDVELQKAIYQLQAYIELSNKE